MTSLKSYRNRLQAGQAWCKRLATAFLSFVICFEANSLKAGTLQNVASFRHGAVAIADSEYAKYTAGQAIDGKALKPGESPNVNGWHASLNKSHPHWIWIQFRNRARIEKVIIHRADISGYPVDFIGEYSPDGGITFFTLFSRTDNHMSTEDFAREYSFKPKVTDNFRLRILRSAQAEKPNNARLSEIEVFGEFVEPATALPPDTSKSGEAKTGPILTASTCEGLNIVTNRDEIEFRSKWLRLAVLKSSPRISALCWDSLGAGKLDDNLLRSSPDGGAFLTAQNLFPQQRVARGSITELDGNVVRYTQNFSEGVPVRWEIRMEPRRIRFALTSNALKPVLSREPLGVRFSFDPTVTSFSPLANPNPRVRAPLPLLLHAADYGTLLVSPLAFQAPGAPSSYCLIAELSVHNSARWDAVVRKSDRGRVSDGLHELGCGETELALEFSVESCPPLPGLTHQEGRLSNLPRSWLNVFQYKSDLGTLANNPVSDNAVQCMFTYADPAVFTPALPGGVEVINLAKASLESYFNGVTGYGVGNEAVQTDVSPSLLIASWDVIRATGDVKLLERWLPTLEHLAGKIISQDRNGNGLPESTRSGVPGEFRAPTGNWWDQINFGHEDAYVSALSFRAFQCLADLEKLAGRSQQATQFERQAERIKRSYVPTFLNPKTGVLAGWKDSQGNLHDYWFLFINGMAITYGLVPEALANSILDRFQDKIKHSGYTRFDLGLPGNLIPIAKSDYGRNALGSPQREDGSDTFGVFENGGASGCYAYFYLQALYKLGRHAEAEQILWPMVESFSKGAFQNGVGHGGEWRRWDGRPSGYEGFLADAYYAQLAIFTGHYGISFDPDGFHLEKWSMLRGSSVSLGLKYMGHVVDAIQ